MLVLDDFARLASQMAEPHGPPSPFRRPDRALWRRHVMLPTVREERRRAIRSFVLLVTFPSLVMGLAGVVVMGLRSLLGGPETLGAILSVGGWYAAGTMLVLAPLVGVALVRELGRYRAVRRTFGDTAWLDAAGVLHSEDGRRRCALHAP